MSETPDNNLPPLSDKQQRFVDEYLDCLNATEAARRAGYKHPNKQGPALLVNLGIAAHVAVGLRKRTLSKEEVLARLTAHARGDMGDFLRVDEEEVTISWSILKQPPRADGEPDEVGAMLNLAMGDEVKPTDLILKTATVKRSVARLDLLAAGKAGKLGLIKKYTLDDKGKVTIELYDAQSALLKLGEAHGIFRDRIADGLDAIAAAARSLDQKLMVDLDPGAAGEVPGEADPDREGPSAL